MTETLEETPTQKTEDSKKPVFKSLEETEKFVSGLSENPPSPMPLNAGDPSPEQPKVEPKKSSTFAGLKDYKGRSFDPNLHRVKSDGSPDTNVDGTLKILPASKRGFADQVTDKVKSFFNTPKSDHEVESDQESQAEAQARSISERAQMQASAEFLKNGYFIAGEVVAGPGFYTDYEKREAIIKSHFIVYEEATGKAFDPPPWLVLLVGLGADFKTTVSTVPECQERLGEIGSGIVDSAVKTAAKRTWLGRTCLKITGFFGLSGNKEKSPPAKSTQAKELDPVPQFPEGES